MKGNDKKMTAEERKRLDRQRFIGLETQQKLLNSLVLITPANGPNTQLAKNLVLAGVNVCIYDGSTVSEVDFESNFLIAYDEIGQKRGESVYNRLQPMNPTGKNQYFDQNLNILQEGEVTVQFLQQFSMICTSFTNFGVMKKWDQITKAANKPYYNLVCAGESAFAYISLGSEYTYRDPPTKKDAKEFKIKSLPFKECFNKEDIKKGKRREYECLQGILMMEESQQKGLSFDLYEQDSLTNEDMLNCMVELGEDIKEVESRDYLFSFARLYGVDYCPVYSVLGSIISQQIIKVVENQQEPAMNWLVFASQEGYASVIKMQEQKKLINSEPIPGNK